MGYGISLVLAIFISQMHCEFRGFWCGIFVGLSWLFIELNQIENKKRDYGNIHDNPSLLEGKK